jgi:hypothetical protein
MKAFFLKLLGVHRVAIAVSLLLATAVTTCRARDNSLVRMGRTLEKTEARARHADSVLAETTKRLAAIDTQFVYDTVRVMRAVSRTLTLRDTLLQHKTDTVLVVKYVEQTDSTIRACTDLKKDCQAYRYEAERKFAAYEERLSVKLPPSPRSCTIPVVKAASVSGTVGGIAGFILGAIASK